MFMCDLNLEPCVEGGIRLQGGTSTRGRVEICYFGVWATVCATRWDTAEAAVACTQLGYPAYGARALHRLDVPDGTGPIAGVIRSCIGGESALYECHFDFESLCPHSEDVGVACREWM